MHKCPFCGYRFEGSEPLASHLEYVMKHDPILCLDKIRETAALIEARAIAHLAVRLAGR